MKMLRLIFLSSFFYSVHAALVSYTHSNMLGSYMSARMVSVLFTLGSTLSLILASSAPRIIRKFGVVRTSVVFLVASSGLLWALGSITSSAMLIPIFILYFSLNAVIFYCIDLFIEHYSTEGRTGNIRGIAMTINNIGWVSMPLVAGAITALYGFRPVYIGAAFAMGIVCMIIIGSQRHFVDKIYPTSGIRSAFLLMRKTPALRRIISINFILQLFYAWMVVYAPLYLAETLGFDWKTIGIIISIMLIPFVLLQYPTGALADRIGIKKPLVISLIIASIATAAFGLIQSNSYLLIGGLLFGTRVGICMLEILTDTYFFKQVTDADTSLISLFRMMNPLAYIIGPMIGAGLLVFMPYNGIFVVLGGILLAGAWYASRLADLR